MKAHTGRQGMELGMPFPYVTGDRDLCLCYSKSYALVGEKWAWLGRINSNRMPMDFPRQTRKPRRERPGWGRVRDRVLCFKQRKQNYLLRLQKENTQTAAVTPHLHEGMRWGRYSALAIKVGTNKSSIEKTSFSGFHVRWTLDGTGSPRTGTYIQTTTTIIYKMGNLSFNEKACAGEPRT